MPGKTAHQIDTEAADWAARFDRGPLTADLEQAFRAWLDGDVRCLGGEVLERGPSDHHPILLELAALPAAAAVHSSRL